eukprot:222721-Pyramimonas_sp.AAC.1
METTSKRIGRVCYWSPLTIRMLAALLLFSAAPRTFGAAESPVVQPVVFAGLVGADIECSSYSTYFHDLFNPPSTTSAWEIGNLYSQGAIKPHASRRGVLAELNIEHAYDVECVYVTVSMNFGQDPQ